jgi:hypothetical protein
MSEDVTSAYGSENISCGRADVSEPGNESQNVTDFPEAAARVAAYGRQTGQQYGRRGRARTA